MKKLLFIPMFCLMFCVLFSSVGMVAYAEGFVEWEYGDDGSYSYVVDGDPDPQLVGDFWVTDFVTGETVYRPTTMRLYYLRLALGVIGEEPAQNVQVSIAIGEPIGEYGDTFNVQATVSADNYDPITVSKWFDFYGEENCVFEQSGAALLVREQDKISNGAELAETLEGGTMSLSDTGNGDIEPGADQICDVVVLCVFGSEPPVLTEANQPVQARLNAITDNPTIGDEATNSAWVTDESGNLVNSLAADRTYTVHFYVRVSGPEAATNARIKTRAIDQQIAYDTGSFEFEAEVNADNARAFSYNLSYPVQTDLRLHYVDGSLTLHQGNQAEVALNPTQFFAERYYSADGVMIGTNGLDGAIAPGLDAACEVTYQFSTTDYNVEREEERAAKEAEKVAKEAEKAEAAKALTFSDKSAVWITNENGYEVKRFGADKTYTVHARVVIGGEGQAEGVRISSSDLFSLSLDENSKSLYFKLLADNLEESTLAVGLQRADDVKEILSFQYVKGSLRATTAFGTYELSDEEFFNYGTGCLIGSNGADGVISAGKDSSVEVTYQVRTVSGQAKSGLAKVANSVNLFQTPVFAIGMLIVALLEFFYIIHLAFHPDNRLSRFANRCRNASKSIRSGFSSARADLRSEKKQLATAEEADEISEKKEDEGGQQG